MPSGPTECLADIAEGRKLARLFATTNPDAPTHWLKRSHLDRAALHLADGGEVQAAAVEESLDLARFSFRLSDNPCLRERYVSAIIREYTGLWHRRFILGEWVAPEGAIYDMLDLEVGGAHVVGELPQIERWWVAIDYGTSNPFVALLVGLGADQRLYVVREWRYESRKRQRQLTDAEYAERLAGGPPDALHALGVHGPAGHLQEAGDALVAVAAAAARRPTAAAVRASSSSRN